jgi:hypothetical protein
MTYGSIVVVETRTRKCHQTKSRKVRFAQSRNGEYGERVFLDEIVLLVSRALISAICASRVAALACNAKRRQNEEVFMSLRKREFVPLTHCVRAMFPALLLTSMAAAEASNLNFLNDTPMSYIKKRDMDSIKSALVEVLNTKNDGETTRCINEAREIA